MYVKLVRYAEGGNLRVGESLFEGTCLHKDYDSLGAWITIDGPDGPVSISFQREVADRHHFFVMNSAGDTIEHFRGSSLCGSPERDARLAVGAAKLA